MVASALALPAVSGLMPDSAGKLMDLSEMSMQVCFRGEHQVADLTSQGMWGWIMHQIDQLMPSTKGMKCHQCYLIPDIA